MAEGRGDSLELGNLAGPSSSKRKRVEPFLSPDNLSVSDRGGLLKVGFVFCFCLFFVKSCVSYKFVVNCVHDFCFVADILVLCICVRAIS
jgi:hypothetical protein